MDEPQYLLVVNHIVSSVFKSVDKIRSDPRFKQLTVLLITQNPGLAEKYSSYIDPKQVIFCSFDSGHEIQTALTPYQKNIVGVICRGDKHVQYLRKIVPYLPQNVLVSSEESLKASTDKQLMRQAFIQHYPEITPNFIEVPDASEDTVREVERHLNYPVIIKPTNLFSSLLIQSCKNREQLELGLEKVFSHVTEAYSKEGINLSPRAIVEEYLSGDFYSTDIFVMGTGNLFFCPLVGYVPAKQIGIDDFFLYKRFIPTSLSDQDSKDAFEVTSKAVDALGLTNSSAHVELIKTADGWKIIELGPRLGRFRNIMYDLGYGIDLSLNDVRIHLGIKPEIKNSLVNYCSAYSIYSDREGTLKKIDRIQEVIESPMTKSVRILAKPGDKYLFAKNGGHALAEFVFASPDRSEYEKMIKFVEENVYADID